VNNGYLINKIYPDLTFRPHPSCLRGGPRGGSSNCGEVVNFFSAQHTIFDVKSGEVRKVNIEVRPTGNDLSTEYNFTNLTPSQTELSLLNEMISFRNERLQLGKRLQFVENADGFMINKTGESFEQVLSSFGIANHAASSNTLARGTEKGTAKGNCLTMLDYQHNTLGPRDSMGCRSRLNSHLKNVAKETESDAVNFFRNIKATLNTVFIDVSISGEGNKQKVSFTFTDGSIITLEITYNGTDVAPSIEVVPSASYTSDDSTLTQFLIDLTNPSVNRIIFSGREISSVYGSGFDGCRDFIESLGVIQEVEVTITGRAPDGRPISWSVKLISQHDVVKTSTRCG
jgi:hypothetical protein